MKQHFASSHRTPIYRDAGFLFEILESAKDAFDHERAYPQSSQDSIYTRYGNPSVRSTEAALKDLEGSEWALLTASGMSAIDTALSIFQESDRRSDTWLFFSELYGGTKVYIEEVLEQRRGIYVKWFEPKEESYSSSDLFERLKELRPRVLFLETTSNPLLIVPDARKVIKHAKELGVIVIVDNTFATPLLWRPLKDGADLVVHSATKYLGGHGNLTAGVICGNDLELKRKALKYRKNVGCILSPDDAYRLETQLKTFELRFRRQCENAAKLAQFLHDHCRDTVGEVLYPGLSTHPTHSESCNLFADLPCGKGFGAMVTFSLKGGIAAAKSFVERVRGVVAYVPTLGDANSILLHVASAFGYKDEGMIRLSVGCEPYEKLETAVKKALAGVPIFACNCPRE